MHFLARMQSCSFASMSLATPSVMKTYNVFIFLYWADGVLPPVTPNCGCLPHIVLTRSQTTCICKLGASILERSGWTRWKFIQFSPKPLFWTVSDASETVAHVPSLKKLTCMHTYMPYLHFFCRRVRKTAPSIVCIPLNINWTVGGAR